MKSRMFFLVLLFTLSGLMGTSCTKDSEKGDPVFALPPETQVGANTFGVTINGKVYVPRDPTGVNVGGATPKGMKLLGGGIPPNDYTEIMVVDGASTVGFKLVIHMPIYIPVGSYILKNSNFQNGIDSSPFNNIYFRIWNDVTQNYIFYGSIEGQAVLDITRRDNGIIAGKFKGNFRRYDLSTEIITITDGRFDINSLTLDNHPFP